MSILGVVLSHPAPSTLLSLLAAHPGVVAIGEPDGTYLPVVLSTQQDDEQAILGLHGLPGVVAVELAFASPTEPSADEHAP